MTKAATELNHALGGIVDLTGFPVRADQTLGKRLRGFTLADLEDILPPDAQADIADSVGLVAEYRNRIEHDQWTTLQPLRDEPNSEPVRGIGEISYIDTTLPAIELLAEVYATLADLAESLYSDLVAQQMLERVAYETGREAAREIGRAVSRITSQPDPRWRWIDHGRP
ncbi:hypothetical protein [Microbacterium aurantiacum]|uniref:hypothetical protein n=1 Tax=Microbacterium aurantiacum TaxID=162393 RepID=UPI000C7FEB66|nr:hypothetical protein [Microbacterium aurantiacum]